LRKGIYDFASTHPSSEPGSFARNTILERFPQFIAQALQDNAYPPAIPQAREDFRDEIAHRPLQPLHETTADAASWNAEAAAYPVAPWLELPWFFAEAFFYRRLLECTGYYQPGPTQGQDPFHRQKQQAIAEDTTSFAEAWCQFGQSDPVKAFYALLQACLWGNRADLTHAGLKTASTPGPGESHLLLIDQRAAVQARLAGGVGRVDFINDNAGQELLYDLALADFLLGRGWAKQVKMHLKDRPYFISDATPADVGETIRLLQFSPEDTARSLGMHLASHLQDGRLLLAEDAFWTSSGLFRQFPRALRDELAMSSLVILKGDLNYRRLLDDRHWPPTTALKEVASYFPAPFVALRTLKSEVIVGLQPGQAEALSASDPTWLINGQRGVIQYLDGN
jgi:hypothetical protein